MKSNFVPKTYNFQSVTGGDIYKILKSMEGNKATGCDNIPAKLLIVAAHMLCEPLRYLVNLSIHTSVFPDLLKMAEVSPVYKKGDVMDRKNYRPISILPSLSTVFEKVIVHQLMMFVNERFSPHGLLVIILHCCAKWQGSI